MAAGAHGDGSDRPLVRLASSYRARPAEQTLGIARELMSRFGISRLTDTTRMDRLGLPVFASVRPRSKTLRVHAGKGVRPLEAQVGALMEAVEHAIAEPQNSKWVKHVRSVAAVAARLAPHVRFVDLVPVLGVRIAPAHRIATVDCEDVGRRRTVFLPAELIFFPGDVVTKRSFFDASTNGLASGNTLEEASLHAIFEVLERDALSMNKAGDSSAWIDPDELPEPFRTLAATWRGLGVELGVRYVPNAFGMACFDACLHEPTSSTVNLAGGSGLHVDREIALARAICEAAQSRLSHIHGGRDDITTFYAKYTDWKAAARADMEAQVIHSVFDKTRRITFLEVPTERPGPLSMPAMLDHLLRRLDDAGFGTVFRYRFDADLNGLHVVKVVIPKCENIEHHRRRVGQRLLARVMADA